MDRLRRPRLRGDFCQLPNQVARMPVAAGERFAKELLIYRLSLPDELDTDFFWYASRYLEANRNSYFKALRTLTAWGFVRRCGRGGYEWTADVEWGADGRPRSTKNEYSEGLVSTKNEYSEVPKSGTNSLGRSTKNEYYEVPKSGTNSDPLTTPIGNNTKKHEQDSRSVGRDPFAKGVGLEVEATTAPAAAGDPRWDAAAAAYEEHYLAAVAGLPPSKVSGRLTPGERREFDALLSAGKPLEDLLDAVLGMVCEAHGGNRYRVDTPECGFWHPLIFREENRVKYAGMWRRQSAALESAASSEALLRLRFGRLGQ